MLVGIGISLAIVAGGYMKNSLTGPASLMAIVVGVTMFAASEACGASLLAFFVSSSILTKRVEADYATSSRRTVTQVLSNGGVSTALCMLSLLRLYARPQSLLSASCAALCCVCGDTWSSELGVLSPGSPRLITAPWRRVPAGTNGGVSLLGTGAAAAGGMFIGAVMWLSGDASFTVLGTDSLGSFLVWGAMFGLIGSLTDSLLGSALQYSGVGSDGKVYEDARAGPKPITGGFSVLDNHQVNLLSAVVTATVALAAEYFYVVGH